MELKVWLFPAIVLAVITGTRGSQVKWTFVTRSNETFYLLFSDDYFEKWERCLSQENTFACHTQLGYIKRVFSGLQTTQQLINNRGNIFSNSYYCQFVKHWYSQLYLTCERQLEHFEMCHTCTYFSLNNHSYCVNIIWFLKDVSIDWEVADTLQKGLCSASTSDISNRIRVRASTTTASTTERSTRLHTITTSSAVTPNSNVSIINTELMGSNNQEDNTPLIVGVVVGVVIMIIVILIIVLILWRYKWSKPNARQAEPPKEITVHNQLYQGSTGTQTVSLEDDRYTEVLTNTRKNSGSPSTDDINNGNDGQQQSVYTQLGVTPRQIHNIYNSLQVPDNH